MEINKIYNQDCYELLQEIESGTIDLLLQDTPFGCTQKEWDIKTIVLFKIMKNEILNNGIEATDYRNTNYINSLWIAIIAMFFVSLICVSIACTQSAHLKSSMNKVNELELIIKTNKK